MSRITPDKTTGHYDRSAIATQRVLRWSNNSPPAHAIYLIGDSTLYEGLNLALLNEVVARFLPSTEIVDLLTSAQSILDAILLIDNLPASSSGIVVVGHSVRKLNIIDRQLSRSKNRSTFGLSSFTLNQFLLNLGVKPRKQYGLFSIDTFWFAAPRILRHYKKRFSSAFSANRKMDIKPQTQDLSKMEELYLIDVIKPYDAYRKKLYQGRAALLEIQQLVNRNPNLELAVLETPLNPSLIDGKLGNDFYDEYIDDFKTFSKENNIVYLVPQYLDALVPSDFADLLHLSNNNAIDSYTRDVAKLLIDQQNDRK